MPYQDQQERRLLLPVALGDSMAVHAILGDTVITEWQLALQFNPSLIKSEILREICNIAYETTKRTVTPTHPANFSNAKASTMHLFACNNEAAAPNHIQQTACG